MIEVNYKDTIYEIYENRSEVGDRKVSTIKDCEVGDLILSKNALYIPVLAIKIIPPKPNMKGRTVKIIYLPNKTHRTTLERPLMFFYDLGRVEKEKMNVRAFAWLELVNQGMDMIRAGKIAYPTFTNTDLMKLLRNKLVLNKLMVRLSMGTIADRLKENQVNEEFIADQITDIIKNVDPKNATLRKWALEMAMKALETNVSAKEDNSMLQSASESLSSLMDQMN
jgi:hypothetical protein